jgi:hypothetical protein
LNQVEFHLNDGRSLAMVEDGSIDFCLSFDSLVHCDADILADYLGELAAKLAPDGVAFIHHSNMQVYLQNRGLQWLTRTLYRARPRRITHRLYYSIMKHVDNRTKRINPHWRASNVSAAGFRDLCAKAGLRCISQEVVNWGGWRLNDCFSTIARETSRWSRPTEVIVNDRFGTEGERMRRLSCKPRPTPVGQDKAGRAATSP